MNSFSLWVGVGATLGLWRLARSVAPRQAGMWVNAGLFVLGMALVGARLFYVALNRAYFAKHPIEAPLIWLGGLEWPGAVAGAWLAMLALVLFYRAPQGKHTSLACIANQLYPLLPTLAITTWVGCWRVGCGYGPTLPPGTWWGVYSLDESGVTSLRWPLQPLAALSLLVFFALLERYVRPLQPAGLLSWLAHLGLLLNLLAASLLRADPAPTWRGMRVDFWMAAGYLACLLLAGLTSLVPRIRGKPAYS